ncbi:nucleoside-diphosphate kinase [Actinoalloteichus caeruleus]|uniref:Nucleoside diphosphate kinase n=1 Tax=Actinoalloteichus caeruleus DSM 43889 TaxID=1120930 RepID=A0ABT1JDT6_ACTCY|nr:Nucleoside diphosphate kinase [Actinoalloteichus caeruleus DSM 43889]
MSSPTDWSALTTLPAKVAAYADEIYFRETWDELSELVDRVPDLLNGAVTVLFKPDAVVGRRIATCLDFLAEHGFRPVAARTLDFTRHMTREIWRFQGNAATLDRFRVIDALMSATPCLLVVFRNGGSSSNPPATVRLRNLKGNGYRGKKQPNGLRRVASSPLPMLSLIHSPDEPIDMIRELGIVLDVDARRELLTSVAASWDGDATEVVRALADGLHAAHPAVTLDPDAAREAVLGALRDSAEDDLTRSAQLVKALETGADPDLTWPELVGALNDLPVPVPRWDLIMVASMVLRMNLPGVAPHIPSDGSSEWVRR